MKQVSYRTLATINLVLIVSLTPAVAMDLTKDAGRAGKWEIFFTPTWMDNAKIDGKNGSSASINSRSSLGLGFAYNLNRNVEVGLLFNASSGSYSATAVEADGTEHTYNGTMYSSTMALTAAYNFLDGPLTPYVGANIGATFIDSNIPTGDTVGGCWYDPWLGYVCSGYPLTYTTTELSYGADLGVRFDTEAVFLKAGIGKNFIDTENAFDITLYTFIFGFKF